MFRTKGTVPAWMPQTSQAAEHMALQETVAALHGHAVIDGDCGNVVADAAKDRSQLAKEAHAGHLEDTEGTSRARPVVARETPAPRR